MSAPPSKTAALTPAQKAVMKRVGVTRCWARSLQGFKKVVDELVQAGLAARVKPPGGKARNMVELTEAGRALLFQMEGPGGW